MRLFQNFNFWDSLLLFNEVLAKPGYEVIVFTVNQGIFASGSNTFCTLLRSSFRAKLLIFCFESPETRPPGLSVL